MKRCHLLTLIMSKSLCLSQWKTIKVLKHFKIILITWSEWWLGDLTLHMKKIQHKSIKKAIQYDSSVVFLLLVSYMIDLCKEQSEIKVVIHW